MKFHWVSRPNNVRLYLVEGEVRARVTKLEDGRFRAEAAGRVGYARCRSNAQFMCEMWDDSDGRDRRFLPREKLEAFVADVERFRADGMSGSEIAARMCVSRSTVVMRRRLLLDLRAAEAAAEGDPATSTTQEAPEAAP